ncbi:MAG TPA: PEP-CTERM sorting domain-containing protein [Tepidisphaeraceae bacterium]|jgi:hypothetical protein|nr:PEP-CTERM sorting domain-containing protein [Tepidisphaeraceae bacterium]
MFKTATQIFICTVLLTGLGFAPTASVSAAPLSWAPPTLTTPTVIDVAKVLRDAPAWKTTPGHLDLDVTKDYVIHMPSTSMTVPGGLGIIGGRNVVVIGGDVRFDEAPAADSPSTHRRGLYVKGSTGTVHVEGLRIGGDHLAEGINIDVRTPGAIVQVQNMRIGRALGSREGHHADVLQTWGGPSQLRVDRLSGFSSYQGFFLNPMDFSSTPVDLFDFRNMNVVTGGYAYWQTSDFPIAIQNVWARSENPTRDNVDDLLWPKVGTQNWRDWADVRLGTPPGGDFVPEGVAGVDYVSPGYVAVAVPEPAALALLMSASLLFLHRRRGIMN